MFFFIFFHFKMKTRLVFVFIWLVVLFIWGLCLRYYFPDVQWPHIPLEDQQSQQENLVSEYPDDMFFSMWNTVLSYLSQGNVFSLQSVISSEWLMFLPYPNDWSLEKYQTFSVESMSSGDFLSLSGSFVRGDWDGSGEELLLTSQEYYDRFIRDQNYLEAPEKFIWSWVVSRGNTLVNLQEMFTGSQIIEYYFSGFDDEYAGLDWKSLYLVFVEEQGGLFLRAIAHGEWTI